MKNLIIYILLPALGIFSLYKLFQSPEKYLKKKTEYLISLSSAKNKKGDMALISKANKITKFIHHNVQMKVNYNGREFKASSLNEFRSYVMAYFKQGGGNGNLEHKDLTVQVKDSKKKGLVNFDLFFTKAEQKIFCKIFLEWIKEKRWYIQKIEIHSCQPVN